MLRQSENEIFCPDVNIMFRQGKYILFIFFFLFNFYVWSNNVDAVVRTNKDYKWVS